LYFGAGSGVARSGGLQFGTAPSSTCPINFLTVTSSSGIVTFLNGQSAGGSINLATSTTGTPTTSVNIASGTTTGSVTIGNSSNTMSIASGTTNIAIGVGSTSTINILNGGGATTGGSVNIANGALQTTTVNIASGTGTGTVTIGNSANKTIINSKNVEIGNNANTSTIIIGPLSQSALLNISTVVNGVRIDSHSSGSNLFLGFGNNPYKVALTGGGTGNFCNTALSNVAFSVNPMTGHHCTAVGHNCLTKNSTGQWNIAIGSDTLANVTTGSFNTALGGNALTAATTTSNNVAVGYQALAGLTTGTRNVAIGYDSDNVPGYGSINTVGNDNTIIGHEASSSGRSNTIVIGKGAHANADNQIIIGKNGGGHTTWIQGSGGFNVNGGPTSVLGLSASSISTTGNINVGGGIVISGTIQNTLSNYNFHNRTVAGWTPFGGPLSLPVGLNCGGVVTSGEFVCTSDIRLKNIIQKIEISDALKFMKNDEVIFEWKSVKDSFQSGYKAQDIIKSGFGHLVNIVENKECKEEIDDDGFVSPEGLQFCMNYSAVIPYHGVVIKHLLKKNEELKTRLELIENENITLKNQLTDILLRLNAAGI
jgi:hypothetical protein